MTMTDEGTQNGSAQATRRDPRDGLAGTSEAAEVLYGAADMAQEVAREGGSAVKGLQTISSGWMGWAHDSYSANVKAWIALLGCKSLQSAGAVQSVLLEEQTKIFADHRRTSLTAWKSTFKYNERAHATI